MAYMTEKENVGKMGIFEKKKNGLTPLKKISIFRLFELVVFLA